MKLSKWVKNNSIKRTPKEIEELFLNRNENKEEIIKAVLPLALSIANKRAFNDESIENNFSSCLMGLANAINSYKEDNAASFITYASVVMDREVSSWYRPSNGLIKNSLQKHIEEVKITFYEDFNEEEGNESWIDKIESDNKFVYDDIFILEEELNKILNKREVYVLLSFFGLKGKRKTADKLAAELKLTNTTIFNVKNKALDKIKGNRNIMELLKENL